MAFEAVPTTTIGRYAVVYIPDQPCGSRLIRAFVRSRETSTGYIIATVETATMAGRLAHFSEHTATTIARLHNANEVR